jgi:hypothetical protein
VRFKEVIFWTIASGGSLTIGYGLSRALSQSSLGAALPYTPLFGPVLLIIFALILGGPIAFIVIGIAKRRWAMVTGSFLGLSILAAGSAGYGAMSDWRETQQLTQRVAALDTRAFAAPTAHHALLAMEYSRSTDCDQLCQLILVNSDYAVALPGIGGDWVVYRKIRHAECLETWYVRRNIQFFGICVTVERVNRIDDGLVIETPMNLPAPDVFPLAFSYRFEGMAYALVERRQWEDRVLSRWISGKIKVGQFESQQIGEAFTRESFYRAALGMRLSIEDLQNATWLWEAR